MTTSQHSLTRGELMRQIAALHAQMARSLRKGGPPPMTGDERLELLLQIVVLEKQLLGS